MALRISAGILGGRRLAVPGSMVRPTQEKVRQALFSMLAPRLAGAKFLDLYAGSGSVGVEAWSRGAGGVVFVEEDRRVAGILRKNVEMCDGECTVFVMDSLKFLRRRENNGPYDIIFADPPYKKWLGRNNYLDIILQLILNGGILGENGITVLEKASGTEAAVPAGWRLKDRRRYGETELLFLEMEC